MSPTRLDLPFLPEAPILARFVWLPLEAIAIIFNIDGLYINRVALHIEYLINFAILLNRK
jgi:hypothetical protein